MTGLNLQEIVRNEQAPESLHVADGCNHIQWIPESELTVFGATEPDVPYMGPCGFCSFPDNVRRQWRRVWVQA